MAEPQAAAVGELVAPDRGDDTGDAAPSRTRTRTLARPHMAAPPRPHAGPHADVDARAWADLVRTVHRQMRSLVGPCRDLEDLTQSALEQVVRGLPRFEGRSEVTTFSYRICAHVAMNHWRGWRRWLRRFDLGTDGAPEPRSTAPEATEAAIADERTRRLHRALDRLAAPKRLVVTLADLEELPASRIAEILGCPEPTVRSRLRQARLDLAAALRRDPLFAQDDADADGAPPGAAADTDRGRP